MTKRKNVVVNDVETKNNKIGPIYQQKEKEKKGLAHHYFF